MVKYITIIYLTGFAFDYLHDYVISLFISDCSVLI